MMRSHGSEKTKIDALIFTLVVISGLVVIVGMLLIIFSDDLTEGGLFGSGEMVVVDFEALTLSPDSGHYLVCPEGFCQNSTPDQITEIYRVPVFELRDRLTRFIDSQQGLERKTLDLQNLQFVFLAYNRSSPFPDVITVKLYDLGAPRSSIAILSQTIKGEDATGRNRTRVQRWLKILTQP